MFGLLLSPYFQFVHANFYRSLINRQNLVRNYLIVEDNITIVCNDLDISQHPIKTVVSGDITNDISTGKRLSAHQIPCILSYAMVRNKISLRKKHTQTSRDLKQGKIFFYETEIRYPTTEMMTLWLRQHYFSVNRTVQVHSVLNDILEATK